MPELLELDEDPLDDPADTLVIPVVVTADESEAGAWQTWGRDLTVATLTPPKAAGYPGVALAKFGSGSGRSATTRWTVAHRIAQAKHDVPRLGRSGDR